MEFDYIFVMQLFECFSTIWMYILFIFVGLRNVGLGNNLNFADDLRVIGGIDE